MGIRFSTSCVFIFYIVFSFSFCLLLTFVVRGNYLIEKKCSYLKYLGWPYKEYIKTAKHDGSCEEWLSENDFEAILATFCCYEYSANASEEVQKITTDQKGYSKCSSCVIVCWIAKTCQSVTVKKGWLLGHLRGS